MIQMGEMCPEEEMKRAIFFITLSLIIVSGCEKTQVKDLCPNDPYKTTPGICGCGNDDVYDIVLGRYICSDPIDLCPNDPDKTEPGICGCGRSDEDLDGNGLADCVDEKIDLCPDDPDKKFPGACGCGAKDIIGEDGSVTCLEDAIDLCPDDPNKKLPGICGCGISDDIEPDTNVPKCIFDKIDLCPDDPDKKLPGACGCGTPDVDSNNNTILDCNEAEVDLCPYDPDKARPGSCGCGMKEIVWENVSLCDNAALDLCPDDKDKKRPGVCGCGVPDIDDDGDTIPDCLRDGEDLCPDSELKVLPGVCGCGVPDDDLDEETGAPKCVAEIFDFCPDDANKMRPGVCGCGVSDTDDTDGDTIPDCKDLCPEDEAKLDPGLCGCGIPDSDENIADSDGDGVPNCLDACPDNRWKSTDDTCECNALFYTPVDAETGLCARLISNAQEFIEFRDNWNDGTLSGTQNPRVFLVVNDINIGEVITKDDASSWVGIGTETYPFDGILVGYRKDSSNSQVTISAEKTTGSVTEKLTLGNSEASNVALFGYTHAARIANFNLKLTVTGDEKVAALIANARETTISNVQLSEGTVSGHNLVGGVVAEYLGGVVKNVKLRTSSVKIRATGDYVGGLAATAENIQAGNVGIYGTVTGKAVVGGVAGMVKTSTLSSCYSEGAIVGGTNTGGIAGILLAHASILNSYSISKITCQNSPCASLVATIGDFSAVKNSYSTGLLVDNIPEVTEPEDPEPEDPEPGEPEDPEPEPIEVPIATLIASFVSEDNVIDKLFYWRNMTPPALPEKAIEMKYVSEPIGFAYYSLIPKPTTSTSLLDVLNGNLTCYGDNSCSLEGTTCSSWTNASRLILRANGTQMTVTLPTFSF